MRMRFVLLAAFLAFDAPARADTPRPRDVNDQEILTPPEAMLDAAREAEFLANVAIGDRERAAGHVPEAAIAYARAIHIRKDPVVGGRLGVLLVQAEKYAQAADLLAIALKHAHATATEREGFFRAYEVARKHGAWVDVVVSQAGAAVALDGQSRNQSGYSAFSIFVVTGEHRLTAVLEGFRDATVPFTVRAGEDMRVEIELQPLLRKLERLSPPTTHRVEPPSAPSTNVKGDPNYNSKEDPFFEDPKTAKSKDAVDSRPTHGFVFAGPVVVLGVASWNPAVGAVVGGAWRPNEYFSLGLEGRAAWLTKGVGGRAISAMTAGGVLSVCGHLRWFYGCALGHAGALRTDGAPSTYGDISFVTFRPGVGGRLGVRFRLWDRAILQASMDALALTNGTRIFVGNQLVAALPGVMVGSQIIGGWEF